MKNVGLALLLLLLAAPASAQQTAPELQFESVPDFLKLPPGLNFGEVIGRSGRNPKQFSGGHALACPMESENLRRGDLELARPEGYSQAIGKNH